MIPDPAESLPRQSCPFVTVWTNPNRTLTLELGLCFVRHDHIPKPAPGIQELDLLDTGTTVQESLQTVLDRETRSVIYTHRVTSGSMRKQCFQREHAGSVN